MPKPNQAVDAACSHRLHAELCRAAVARALVHTQLLLEDLETNQRGGKDRRRRRQGHFGQKKLINAYKG